MGDFFAAKQFVRSSAAVLVVVLASIPIVACGTGTRHHDAHGARTNTQSSASRGQAGGPSVRSEPASAASRSRTVPPPLPAGPYLNDGDHDHAGDPDGDNAADNDGDAYYDYKPSENAAYHDGDDRLALTFGHPADAADRQAIAAAVKRYYSAAAAGDTRTACSLVPAALVKAMPIVYGRSGPPYLRGAKTCEAVLARLFRRHHHELSAPVRVTGVRVAGDSAYALFGSNRMPASYITIKRVHGAWTTGGIFGVRLP